MGKNYRNILIVRTDRIGDVVLTSPVFKIVRDNYPQAKINVLVSLLTYDLVKGNPFIDDVIVDDRKGVHRGIKGFFRLVNEIRQQRFDLAVVFHTKRRTNSLCFLGGIKQRTGFRDDKFGFLLNDPLNDERSLGIKHETEYCLDVLRHLGMRITEPELFVPVHDDAEKWADEVCVQNHWQKESLIAIHPAASDPSKCWPPDKFAELMDMMGRLYRSDFVILGSQSASNLSGTIMSYLTSGWPRVCDLSGKTSIRQLSSLLRRCKLLISNDSGPVHIADGVGTPVVSIFTRNQPGINSERWKPFNSRSRTVSVPFDDSVSFKKAGEMPIDYEQKIPVSSVLEAVDSIYKLC
jgi:heptosyltransferase-2